MDFGRALLKQEGIATRSNIRVLAESSSNTSNASLSLDDRLIRAANRAAIDLLGAANSSGGDSSLFCEHVLVSSPKIQPNDLIVVFESFDNLNFVYAKPNATFTNRNGVFSHNDFIGQSWGCKIRSVSHSGYGFVYLLRPTPELWARSLPHRTQIIHELDTSQILFQLDLRPNMVLVESGTGSGALSHAALRTLAPHGHLHTFEFHQARAEKAQEEFQNHTLSHLVTVYHQDVTQGFFGLQDKSSLLNKNNNTALLFVDAVVLDLPEPWLAIPHTTSFLKHGGRIACYSPCMEQVQRSTVTLAQCGFHSIKTLEYRLREYYVDPVYYDPPPNTKRPGRHQQQQQQEEDNNDDTEGNNIYENEPDIVGNELDEATKKDKEDSNGGDQGRKRKRLLCARPFATMKGHSAFLTFATAGNNKKGG